MNLREQYSKETGNSFEKIPINGVHLEYIEWLEKKLKENMVEELSCRGCILKGGNGCFSCINFSNYQR